jgi:hypothetical protein
MFINELSFVDKLDLVRNGLGFRMGLDWEAKLLGCWVSWRGPQEYPNAVLCDDTHSKKI